MSDDELAELTAELIRTPGASERVADIARPMPACGLIHVTHIDGSTQVYTDPIDAMMGLISGMPLQVVKGTLAKVMTQTQMPLTPEAIEHLASLGVDMPPESVNDIKGFRDKIK